MKCFLIAAPASGSGKTTVARGLMSELAGRGLAVQPFKCGPDYIDTKFHSAVCGRPSVNLDTFMATPAHVRELFARYADGADVCVVEGMMGLFDGYDRDRGSSAEIACALGISVVLVVDARSAAYSLAPLLKGFATFRADLRICGVIFNKVGSTRHRQMLLQVCEDTGLKCLGFLSREARLETGSRYLGLDFSSQRNAQQNAGTESLFSSIADAVLETIPDMTIASSPAPPPAEGRVLIARNAESFSFLYQEVIDRFADVAYFDPETDVPQLDDIHLLYLPGGYPEKHLPELSKNEGARQAIKDYADRGGRIVAECGGMMYLCESIIDDGGNYPMCGVLSYTISARRENRRLSLGYRRFTLDGCEYRGHEFHYTQFSGELPPSAAQVFNAAGEPVPTPVIRQQNVLASYTHLYQI